MWEVSPLALERLRRYGAAMKRFAPFIMLALSLSSLSLFFTGEGDLHALRGLQHRLKTAKERNGRLQEYVQELREHNTRIKRDPRFLEHVVRNELGLVRDGEVVFVFEGAEAQNGLEAAKR
jgi:cell division protein FtsB